MSKEVLSVACLTLAERIMFIGVSDATHWLNILGLEYRKGKDVEDIRKAVKKGLKDGMGKTEHELSMIEIHLTKVLRLKK